MLSLLLLDLLLVASLLFKLLPLPLSVLHDLLVSDPLHLFLLHQQLLLSQRFCLPLLLLYPFTSLLLHEVCSTLLLLKPLLLLLLQYNLLLKLQGALLFKVLLLPQ